MFKVGDKGKTRDGLSEYEIVSIGNNDHTYRMRVKLSGPDESIGGTNSQAGELDLYTMQGNWYDETPRELDLMPPDSHHYNTYAESGPDKGEVEMPEYLPEEVAATAEYEYDSSLTPPSLLEELADLSCRYGIQVDYDIETGVVIFNRTNSAT